jgi:hypothetical protein
MYQNVRTRSKQYGLLRNPSQKGVDERHHCNHGHLGPTFSPLDKDNITADHLENQFLPRGMCDYDHKRQVEAMVGALLAGTDSDTHVKFRPCDVSKQKCSLKLGEPCNFYGIPNKCLRNLPRYLAHLSHLFTYCLRLCHFLAPWAEAKIITLPKSTNGLTLVVTLVP